MPRKLPLDARAKNKMKLLYSSGQDPADIAVAMKPRGIAITAKQVRNLVCREGWAREKAAIALAREKGAKELLAEAQAAGAADLEQVLKLIREGQLVDAQRLVDGWDLVQDAAGASSLMRAKTLLDQRIMRFHGLDAPQEEGQRVLLAAVFGRPVGSGAASSAGAACVDVACADPDEGEAGDDSNGDRLEFE